jgi:hypothetical protein
MALHGRLTRRRSQVSTVYLDIAVVSQLPVPQLALGAWDPGGSA